MLRHTHGINAYFLTMTFEAISDTPTVFLMKVVRKGFHSHHFSHNHPHVSRSIYWHAEMVSIERQTTTNQNLTPNMVAHKSRLKGYTLTCWTAVFSEILSYGWLSFFSYMLSVFSVISLWYISMQCLQIMVDLAIELLGCIHNQHRSIQFYSASFSPDISKWALVPETKILNPTSWM